MNALNCAWPYTADHHPERIRKIGKLFGDELDFDNIKFQVKIKNICKIKKNAIGISFFVYEYKEKYLLYVPNITIKKQVDLFLLEEKDKKHYTFIYNHTLH